MNDAQEPELVPSVTKMFLLAVAFGLMAAGASMLIASGRLVGLLVAYGGVLLIFGCYAHGNGERNRLRAMRRHERQN